MTFRRWNLLGSACVTLLAVNPLGLANAEEASIMTGATVDSAQLHSYTPSGDVIINGSFKSFISTASSTNPVDAQIVLS